MDDLIEHVDRRIGELEGKLNRAISEMVRLTAEGTRVNAKQIQNISLAVAVFQSSLNELIEVRKML